MLAADSIQRFSTRADDYSRARPGYPAAVVDELVDTFGLVKGARVADIAAGTGIFTELLLRKGLAVTAVEPNADMRAVLQRLALPGGLPVVVDGTAEHTSLPDASVSMVVAAQAFHWFDPDRARTEFARILTAGGGVALIWNLRDGRSTVFLREFEALLQQHCKDYARIKQATFVPETLAKFFGREGYRIRDYENSQRFDFERLRRLVLSTSYAPAPAEPGFEPMIHSLSDLFARNASSGEVDMHFTCRVVSGTLSSNAS